LQGASLEVQNLFLAFGKVTAVNNVSLKVRAGELVSIIGPNGAGKTSLLNCINGFYRPQSGRILLDGRDVTKVPMHVRARMGIARTFQNVQLYLHETVLDNVRAAYAAYARYDPISLLKSMLWLGPAAREEEKVFESAEEIIDYLEMWEYRNRVVAHLPLGLKRRVELARALALNPKVLLLDEPMSGLTFDEKYDMVRFILDLNEEKGITVLLIEHDLKVVMEVTPRVVVMHQGIVIADGPPLEVATAPKVIEAYIGGG
jgi:amino acid/amide ABC transporter ATP-binding protein 1, HAAT family (TC 3.A.1.4.-)